MARLKIYNLATGQWEYVSLPEHRHVGGVEKGSATLSFAGHGSGTFGTTACEWSKVGNIVSVRFSFNIAGNGTGTSTVTCTFVGCPPPANTARLLGDRGGTGVNAILFRAINNAGDLHFSEMKPVSTFATITGADLAAGATYTCLATYLTSDADSAAAFTGYPVA